jgi:hypothetical protein
MRFPATGGGAGEEEGGFGGPRGTEAAAGTYRVTLTVDGQTWHTTVTVRDDPETTSIAG